TLREVTIERYVHRLRLEATIPAPLFNLLDQFQPITDRPMLKAIARRPVWENENVRNIFESYLDAAGRSGRYQLADAIDLLDLVENRKPADLMDLRARLPRWQDALREQIDTASAPKPFFSRHAEVMHGGGRDQRTQQDA